MYNQPTVATDVSVFCKFPWTSLKIMKLPGQDLPQEKHVIVSASTPRPVAQGHAPDRGAPARCSEKKTTRQGQC